MSSPFYTLGGRSNTPQMPFRSLLAGISPDPATQILQRRPDLIGGKRSLAQYQIQQQQQNQLQQQQSLGLYLRNVKQRMFQQASPPMNLSPVSEISSLSDASSNMNLRFGIPIFQQPRTLPTINSNTLNNFGSFQNYVQNLNPQTNLAVPTSSSSLPPQDLETKMMNRLQELEKQLLDDNDDGDQEAIEAFGVINNEFRQLISVSPTSSSSSCSSTSASPTLPCPKQSIIDAASSISEGKADAAVEFLTRLSKLSNVKGTPEQRLTAYMVSALRSRVNSTEFPPPVSELFSQDHSISTHKLYDVSTCFKLGFMAANLAILEATTMADEVLNKLHVIDFDIGQGGQYVHLLHALASKKVYKPSLLKITTFNDLFSRKEEERLKVVGNTLKSLANKIGINLVFNLMNLKINDLTREILGSENDEFLAVNLAFKLYKLPNESVTTENLRDEVLRRVKRLSPNVVTVVEQEMNCNTASFVGLVNEVFGYYSALFESLESVVSRESSDRVIIEQGLGRKMANSVACEGSDRVERCEVYGKWRARMGMAGFRAKPMSQLGSVTRGNVGFTVSEQSGGICFGWMGRSLTVASAWH